jgi:hypothetical protein
MRAFLGACALALLAACRTSSTRPDVPAVVAEPGAQARAELAAAVSSALGGVPVRLADDALTRESTLVLERAKHRDASGLPVQGREMGTPERFHLVKSGPDCVLIHEGSGRRFSLHETTCAPLQRG